MKDPTAKESQADRTRRAVARPTPPLWLASVREHTIAGRYPIPAREGVEVYAADRLQACRQFADIVQMDAGVPLWLPWLRETYRHVRVERTVHE